MVGTVQQETTTDMSETCKWPGLVKAGVSQERKREQQAQMEICKYRVHHTFIFPPI